jgi:tetratricopeptide (TPR) repeat protein
MVTRRLVRASLLIVLLVSTLGFAVEDAKLAITASVNQTKTALNTPIILSVSLSGENVQKIPNPQLPDLKSQFRIGGTAQSTSFSWINGQVSSARTINYTLIPTAVGVSIIDSVAITWEGKTYRSKPIKVRVTRAKAAAVPVTTTKPNLLERSRQPVSNPDPKVFIRTNVDKQTVYTGEEINFQIHLFRRVSIWSNISIDQPKFKGFLVNDQKPREETIQNLNAKRYYVFEVMNKALFPLEPGEFTIEPAVVSFVLNTGREYLKTDPVTITVLPLPQENKPPFFEGAVGEFQLSASINATEIKVNNPINVQIHIDGKGNHLAIKNVHFESSDDTFKIYRSEIEDSVDPDTQKLNKRILNYVVVPLKTGDLTVPSFFLAFFNPKIQTYETLQSDPTPIHVEGAILEIGGKDQKRVSVANNQNIRYLKKIQNREKAPIYFHKNPLFWIIVILNGLGYLFFSWVFIQKNILKKELPFQKKNEYKTAMIALEALEIEIANDPSAVSKAQNIALDYLARKFNLPVQKMTRSDMEKEIENKGFSKTSVQKISQCFDRVDYIGFSPSDHLAAESKQILNRVKQIIKHIHKSLKLLIITGLLVVGMSQAAIAEPNPFIAAEALYQQGLITQAEAIYKALLIKNPRQPSILYNLGNCYFKEGYIGKSIAMYKTAIRFAPRDADIRSNLRHLKSLSIDDIASQKSISFQKTLVWVEWLSINEWIGLALILLTGFNGIGILWFFGGREEFMRKIFIGSLLFSIVFSACFIDKVIKEFYTNRGIIIVTKTAAKSGPNHNLSTVFYIHEGTEFVSRKKSNDWVEIQLANGFIGWIPAGDFWSI